MRINEWSVMDSADAIKAIRETGITVPVCSGPSCWARQHQGLTCSRAPGHHGRHAAAGTRGVVYAVWS